LPERRFFDASILALKASFFGTNAVFLALSAAHRDIVSDLCGIRRTAPLRIAPSPHLGPRSSRTNSRRQTIAALRHLMAVFWPADCFLKETCFENAQMAAAISILRDFNGVFAPRVLIAAKLRPSCSDRVAQTMRRQKRP
jgi:hypothetical protein